MNLQDININRLETLGIYELRELGRMVGVTRPTSLRRDELIEGIKHALEQGESQDTQKPVRGRKPRGLGIDFSKIVDNDGFNSHFNSILSQMAETQVRDSANSESRVVSGYVHLLPNTSSLLIATDLNGYPISTKLMRTYNLKTGDFIEGKAFYNSVRGCFTVEEATQINKCEMKSIQEIQNNPAIHFDKLEGTRPSIACTANNANFLFGERVLFVNPKPFDRIEDIAKTAIQIKNAHKIALLIDETEDSMKFLQESSVNDIYYTKVNFSIQKQTVACLLALFRAKESAEQGNNVILFTDSLNKLFKIYNNSAYPDGRIMPDQVNLAPLADLKSYFLSARMLKNGGSLTVIAYINEPNNPIETYLHNEFSDLAQQIFNR